MAERAAKKKEMKKNAAPNKNSGPDRPLNDVARLNLKVGKIVEAWEHPESEKLWCEKIDVGEGELRQIASGLRKTHSKADMEGKMVVVCCNLKARKLAGFESQGMVMCAENADASVINFLTPPEGAKLGDRVVCDGQDGEPDERLSEKKDKKPWEVIAPNLHTVAGADGIAHASYDGRVFSVAGKPITCGNLPAKSIIK